MEPRLLLITNGKMHVHFINNLGERWTAIMHCMQMLKPTTKMCIVTASHGHAIAQLSC